MKGILMASTKRRPPKRVAHHDFPRLIERFTALEGGQYGSMELLAISQRTLELQLGDDFVQFSQSQARGVRDAFDRFLALKPHHVEHVVEDVIEVVEHAPRRPQYARGRRGRPAVIEEVVAEVIAKDVGRRSPKGRRARATPA
jgi:hypothetical protein